MTDRDVLWLSQEGSPIMGMGRPLYWILALATVLHAIDLGQSFLPAQDGLKFLRVARAFHHQPWADVVRASDQHPLYPVVVASLEPVLRVVLGPGPETWRLTAQLVSVLAALATVGAIHRLARTWLSERAANLAALFAVISPFPALIGHDTLADSLALALVGWALVAGDRTLTRPTRSSALMCGTLAGLGFLARPEAVLAGIMAVNHVELPGRGAITALAETQRTLEVYQRSRPFSDTEVEIAWAAGLHVAAYNAAFEYLHGARGAVAAKLADDGAERLRLAGC